MCSNYTYVNINEFTSGNIYKWLVKSLNACFENSSQDDTRNRVIAFYKNRINKQRVDGGMGSCAIICALYNHFYMRFVRFTLTNSTTSNTFFFFLVLSIYTLVFTFLCICFSFYLSYLYIYFFQRFRNCSAYKRYFSYDLKQIFPEPITLSYPPFYGRCQWYEYDRFFVQQMTS